MTSPTQSSIDYTKEIRFAVVMYGGVSLAIYINGVAQELYRLVLSTAAVEQDTTGSPAALAGKTIGGTERVYRKLSHLVQGHLIRHQPASRIGRSVSRSFIIPSRVRVFTVPSG